MWNLLDESHQALRVAVAGVDDADWELPTPCALWNVSQVLRHAAGDQRAYAATLTGVGGPTEDPFAPSADRPADPRTYLDSALSDVRQAFDGVAPGTAVPTPLPLGPLAAEIAVGAAALDAAVHAWDIAVATGQPSPLSADLADRLTPAARAIVEPLRAFAFAPALPPQAGDDATDLLLRYLGRDPRRADAKLTA